MFLDHHLIFWWSRSVLGLEFAGIDEMVYTKPGVDILNIPDSYDTESEFINGRIWRVKIRILWMPEGIADIKEKPRKDNSLILQYDKFVARLTNMRNPFTEGPLKDIQHGHIFSVYVGRLKAEKLRRALQLQWACVMMAALCGASKNALYILR